MKALIKASKELITNCRDIAMDAFCKPTAIPAQVIIGLGCVFLMPLILLTNKKVDKRDSLYAATRTFVRESIAMPASLTTAAICGIIGSKLAKLPINKLALGGLASTGGFALTNFFIPQITTMALNKLPIKEKIQALALKNDKTKLKTNTTVNTKIGQNNYYARIATMKPPSTYGINPATFKAFTRPGRI